MKFNQYLWNLYKNSPDGKSAIVAFSDRKEWMEEERLFEKYNPKIKDSFNSEMICGILEDFWCYKVSEYEGIELKSLDDAGKMYEEIISTGLMIESEEILKIGDFDRMLEHIPFLSMELNYLFGEYFFPYIYVDEFYQLTRLADYFEIELPPIPKKSDRSLIIKPGVCITGSCVRCSTDSGRRTNCLLTSLVLSCMIMLLMLLA